MYTTTIGRCIDEFYTWSDQKKQACIDYYGWHKAQLVDAPCVVLRLLELIADDSGHVPYSMWVKIKARINKCL
jgi:hypothetical protein